MKRFCTIHKTCSIFAIIFCTIHCFQSFAQPGTSIELKKPHPYENRTLPSEKTGQKKFTIKKRLYQNMVTHYNYYFNASAEIDKVIAGAKSSFRDDYTLPIIPFYNYSLDVTATYGTDIDSIIYRCAEGVLLHDLRSDWVDHMYFLLGKAYFLRKNFDSSTNCFRYINYAFAPKDDGYDIPVGSNVSNTDGQMSIATKENSSLWKKILSKPPARNDAILALCRNYIEVGNYNQAASLLEIIRNDPNFPPRLHNELDETLAYWFYKQNLYDSAAYHLSKALKNADNKFEQARWEYLTAQLYQAGGDTTKALAYYNKSIDHTPDPIMDVYANLNIINISGTNNENVLQQRLQHLIALGKRDKYAQYRDIIYYATAGVEMQLKNRKDAIAMLHKSIDASLNNPKQKALSFLMLADITYDDKSFIAAHNFYDSVSISQLAKTEDRTRAALRQSNLKIIAANLKTIHLEDSLQAIAKMSESERTALLKKIAKQQMKDLEAKQTLLQQNSPNINPAVQMRNPDANITTLSPTGSTPAAGGSGWYFNNNTLKTSGYSGFHQSYGNRPNVDNWFLQSAIDKLPANLKNAAQRALDSTAFQGTGLKVTDDKQSAYTQLLSKIPLTPDKLKISNHNIAQALFTNGKTFQENLENYPAAIDSYNELNRRFGKNEFSEQSLFNQYYCDIKEKNQPEADSCQKELLSLYPNTKLLKGMNAMSAAPVTSIANPATAVYDHVYDLFISGNFDSAKAAKTRADSLYGKNYWTPQLLYIEAIYYVSKKEDSSAINRLRSLATMYPTSPLAQKANTMIDVLKRRKEIESYLTSLQVTRREDDAEPVVTLGSTKTVPEKRAPPKQDSVVNRQAVNAPQIKKDTTTAVVAPKAFSFNALDPQYVLIVLDSVAPVYANEAGNAFNRYNLQYDYNEKVNVTSVKLDSRYNLVLLGPFANALLASQYVDKTKPKTAGTILPWLRADKFSFLIISESNMNLLKDNKDVAGYKKLLHQSLPQQF